MSPASTPLTLGDIADARAYERERAEFRDRIIQLKKVRRVPVGAIVTFVFENRDTIRFQIQEMARAEKLYSDEAIQEELNTYNPLIPGVGELSATMFIELTSKEELEYWLPRLTGIEQAPRLVIGEGSGAEIVPARVDTSHAAQLTREETTASVHYVAFSLGPAQVARFRDEPVKLGIDHPEYREETLLSEDTKMSLLEDLSGK
ncbi:MAG TPA: DUF3501 family protein [Acidimicrobiales bacterium]